MLRQAPIAKISRPRISGICARKRLFRLLDEARKRLVIWITGPAGSGKTTLAVSYLASRKLPCLWYQVDAEDADVSTFFYYMGTAAERAVQAKRRHLPALTPEYLQGITIFTRRYFENLCAGLKPPYALVFDNYQDAPPDSDFNKIIMEGLDVIPEGIQVVVMSRSEPPPEFARLRADGRLFVIGWEDIRFTPDETGEMVQMRGWKDLPEETLLLLHSKTEGWAAGLVLMTEVLRTTDIASALRHTSAPQEIFDYFAGEIFDKTDAETQRFFLMTAFLPVMTVQMAERLTGMDNSARILSGLSRKHYFTERHIHTEQVYQYHPLFREFLLSRGRETYRREDLLLVRGKAAELLEESGQVEYAAVLLWEAEDWQGLGRLIMTHAQTLFGQGRDMTVQEWLARIPGEIIEDTPWLLYWMGLCRMPYSVSESREFLDRAFHGFKRLKDSAGLYLSWSGIVDTFVYEWGNFHPLDHWISEFEALRLEFPEFPSREAGARVASGMFCALMYRQTDHPDLPLWESRVREIVLNSPDTRLQATLGSQLILYYSWWTGDLAKAAVLVDALKSSIQSRETDPMSFIVRRAIEAAYYWMVADYDNCMDAVNEGLGTADETGIHIWDFMLCAVGATVNTTSGYIEETDRFLDRMTSIMNLSASMEVGFYHYWAIFASLYRGDLNVAYEHARSCVEALKESGVTFAMAHGYFALGIALLERDSREDGLACLAKAKEIARTIKSKTAEYLALLSEAWYFLRKGEEAPGLRSLSAVLALGRENGFVNNSAWHSSRMAFLCEKALEHGIETEHVRDLIRRRELVPLDPSVEIEGWPRFLEVRTLGKFEIIRWGEPVFFSGKVKQVPLNMLKALVAFGGRDVSGNRIADVLWPDADGDLAQKSFDTTLHRLRKLIGNEKALQLREGLLTLDDRFCLVDVWTFERLFDEAQEVWDRIQGRHGEGKGRKKWSEADTGEVLRLQEKTFNIYGGHFLPADEREPWTPPARERLQGRFQRLVMLLGRCWEQAGMHEKTLECFHRGLETDNLAEEFYQQLMLCYIKLGQQAKAARVYERCRETLRDACGLEPSLRTEEIFSEIRRD